MSFSCQTTSFTCLRTTVGFSVFHSKKSMLFSTGALLSCVLVFSHAAEIIGGKEATRHSLPFIALLEDHGPTCGGTLINSKWVLTAAHCAGVKKVTLGLHSIKSEKQEKNFRQVRKVSRQEIHPCYNQETKVNDLMLLKLNKAVKKTKWVSWLTLGKTTRDPEAGAKCLVAGWGKTSNTVSRGSDVLMSTNVTVIDRKTCDSQEYYNRHPVINSDMICAGSVGKERHDTCSGDSGGPLLCNNALVGVTSFGEKCGVLKRPGVYSFLSKKQLVWIMKTTKK